MDVCHLIRLKAWICCSEIETKRNTSSVKGSDEDEMETIFFKSDIYDSF